MGLALGVASCQLGVGSLQSGERLLDAVCRNCGRLALGMVVGAGACQCGKQLVLGM